MLIYVCTTQGLKYVLYAYYDENSIYLFIYLNGPKILNIYNILALNDPLRATLFVFRYQKFDIRFLHIRQNDSSRIGFLYKGYIEGVEVTSDIHIILMFSHIHNIKAFLHL